jgi:hypothetical protein
MSKTASGEKDVLRIENFKGKNFNSRDFIESLSYKLTAEFNKPAKDGQEFDFDPRPFIRTFESVTEELLRLKRKITSKIEDLEDQQAAQLALTRRKVPFQSFNR